MKWMKRQITVNVKFATQAGVQDTLEGLVPYQKGDALMVGVAGEHWPIPRARFEQSYTPEGDTVMGSNGMYHKKPLVVDARQVTQEEYIDLVDSDAVLHAMPGDWLITDPDGRQWVVAQDIFSASYQAIPESR